MDGNTKVFSSEIIRGQKPLENNLYELINIIPAQPISTNNIEKCSCDFQPKCDKYYVPKKKSKIKVKTVGGVRESFEKDVYMYLPQELEKQQNILLRKIRGGSSRDEDTKTLARNILKCDTPISRSTWQMLMNINPQGHTHSIQYVSWSGKRVRINGSRGGKNKFICNYDIGGNILLLKSKSCAQKKAIDKKKSLLRNSLAVKFKPGPLAKKKCLDESYQKYHVGNTELINLPKIGLDIHPAYGVSLESTITNFVHNLRAADGTISAKWAEYAVSMIGTIKNGQAVQINESCVSFDLNYKHDQNRILMRRHIHNIIDNNGNTRFHCAVMKQNETVIINEIKEIIDNMINTVQICLNQDNMYSGQEEPRSMAHGDSTEVHFKDKQKRKFSELERLDVTIIKLSETSERNSPEMCNNLFCSLGCVCASLQCAYNIKTHCGHIECMFKSKCDYTKYKPHSTERNCAEKMPGLLKLDNYRNLTLSKEEKKFHQTVIMKGENSMLWKSRKRDWKTSKKYADFYSNMCLKTESKPERILSVVLLKLNCENIEPWCMVHSLYKCFCKGKFLKNSIQSSTTIIDEVTTCRNNTQDNSSIFEAYPIDKTDVLKPNRNRLRQESNEHLKKHLNSESDDSITCTRSNYDTCARLKPYSGRNYADEYYVNTHNRMLEMEKNDSTLRKKMIDLMNMCESNDQRETQEKNDIEEQSLILSASASSNDEITETNVYPSGSKDDFQQPVSKKTTNTMITLPSESELIKWLESSYKHYKHRLDKGIIKLSLEAPKYGKMALYPWDFISNRYKERKNYFMVSKQRPFRIFMAVDAKNNFFQNCVNIDDIRFAELHKYPISVKNLLTNSTDLQNMFCILCGLSHCWEIIGSVTKVNEQKENNRSNENIETADILPINSPPCDLFNSESVKFNENLTKSSNKQPNIQSDSSKWFVMVIEKDFNEIQFHRRGFFVKYESIEKAIHVARVTGKTVRLSSQKFNDTNKKGNISPHFGIYAIPNINEYCVFIGPYEKDEPLGIETVKNILNVKNEKTRGVWITTNKVDNSKIIDYPLLFMPQLQDNNKMILLENEILNGNSTLKRKSKTITNKEDIKEDPPMKTSKTDNNSKSIKPITIRKTNGFYHLATNNIIRKNPTWKNYNQDERNSQSSYAVKLLLNQSIPVSSGSNPFLISTKSTNVEKTRKIEILKKPVAEIAPQIKITQCYSLSEQKSEAKMPEPNMFILKPEEINKKLENKLFPNTNTDVSIANLNQEIEMDIENFLATSKECGSPNNDICYLISDDEVENNSSNVNYCQTVWIQCKNVDLGWIEGRRNIENNLSFEFPGFKYTDFYTEKEAFTKINQVLSRKVYIPKHINLEWEVIESKEDVKSEQLKSECLGPNFVLTERGLRRKNDLLTNSKKVINDTSDESVDSITPPIVDRATYLVSELNKTSDALDEETEMLLLETVTRQREIRDSFSRASDDLRQQMTDELNLIMTDANT